MSSSDLSILLHSAAEKAGKAIQIYLKSVHRLAPSAQEFLLGIDQATEKEMEPYDALTSRFERATEMVLGQLAKAITLFEGAASQGTLRDRLILLEKLNLIDSVDLWMSLREVGNRIVHEYSAEDLPALYRKLLFQFPSDFQKFQGQLDLYLKKRISP